MEATPLGCWSVEPHGYRNTFSVPWFLCCWWESNHHRRQFGKSRVRKRLGEKVLIILLLAFRNLPLPPEHLPSSWLGLLELRRRFFLHADEDGEEIFLQKLQADRDGSFGRSVGGALYKATMEAIKSGFSDFLITPKRIGVVVIKMETFLSFFPHQSWAYCEAESKAQRPRRQSPASVSIKISTSESFLRRTFMSWHEMANLRL